MAKRPGKSLISFKSWRKLFDLAVEIYNLAPWERATEDDFFGVQDPITGEIAFVSVMGMLGDHFAIGAYLGPEGLYGYWRISDAGPFGDPHELLNVPQLQLSFEDKHQLTKKDRDLASKSGHRFRGQNSWPMFRSYKPGFFPWYLEADEVEFLTHILEQCLDVLPRYFIDGTILDPVTDETYLVRVPEQKNNDILWHDQQIMVPEPEEQDMDVPIDPAIIKEFNNLEQKISSVDVDFFMLPSQIQEKKNERPYFGYMLMAVDSKNGMVLATELLAPKPSFDDMWANLPESFLQTFVKFNLFPKKIQTSSTRLLEIMEPVAKDLGFSITLVDYLPALEEAKDFILTRFL